MTFFEPSQSDWSSPSILVQKLDETFRMCTDYRKLNSVTKTDSPRRLFCFGSLVILDVARCYLWLFTLYINIKISKNSC